MLRVLGVEGRPGTSPTPGPIKFNLAIPVTGYKKGG
jgi:hypothetical protein